MDHDAMLTHVRKLMAFRDDFLAASGVTIEQLHEMAEHRRANKPIEDFEPARLADASVPVGDGISMEQFRDLTDHVKEISEVVSELQLFQSAAQTNLGTLAWLTANREALEALIAGAGATAGASDEAKGDEAPAEADKPTEAPAGASEAASGA